MVEFYVDLNKIEDIKMFVNTAESYDCDIIVKNKERVFSVDGSSLMGVMSLDLSQPVLVQISDIEAGESFKNDIYTVVVD
jgi:phosphotransferase system HPr-like phosphotransfer protein